MGNERISFDLDSVLLARLKEAGVDPQAFIERELRRRIMANETGAETQSRAAQWKA